MFAEYEGAAAALENDGIVCLLLEEIVSAGSHADVALARTLSARGMTDLSLSNWQDLPNLEGKKIFQFILPFAVSDAPMPLKGFPFRKG